MFSSEPPPAPLTPSFSVKRAMWRGWRGKCPSCGKGNLFKTYLNVFPNCPICGEDLSHHRSDDAPPYITMVIVGHIVGLGILLAEQFYDNVPLLFHLMLWPLISVLLSLWILPKVKGAFISIEWALGLHGFSKNRKNK